MANPFLDETTDGQPAASTNPFLAPAVPKPKPAAPAEGPSFRDYASQVAKGVSLIPGEVRQAYVGALRGSQGATTADEVNAASLAQLRERQQFTSETEKRLGPGFVSQMVQSLPDLGYSLGTLPVSIAAGSGSAAAAAPVAAVSGPAAPFVLGAAELAGAAAATYPLMARADQYRNALSLVSLENDKRTAAGQQALTTDEAKALIDRYQTQLEKSGQWEAGPEALSSAIDAALLSRLPGGRLLGKAVKTAAGIALGELPTETITQIGQSQALQGTPLAPERVYNFDRPGDWVAAAREVLPAVLTMTGVTTAGGVAAAKGIDSVRSMAQARKLGIDQKTLKARAEEVLRFKATNPNVEVTDADINTFLSAAVKAPQEVAEEIGTAPAAENVAASAQVVADLLTQPADQKTASVGQTLAEQQKDVAAAALDRVAATRAPAEQAATDVVIEQFLRKKDAQKAYDTLSGVSSKTMFPAGDGYIVKYRRSATSRPTQGVTSDLSTVRQEALPGTAEVSTVRPEPQADEGVGDATRQAQVQEGVQQERQRVDGDLPEEGQDRGVAPEVGEGGAPAVAGDRLPGQAGEEEVTRAPEVPSEPVATPAAETLAEVQTAMPRLKRGYRRSYFVVNEPAYAGNVFVEETSAKGKTTLYLKKRGGQVEKASQFISDRIAGKQRVPYEGATFDEQVTPTAALRSQIEREANLRLPADAFVEVAAPQKLEAAFAELERALQKRIVFFRNNSPIAFNGVTGIVPDTLFVNIDAQRPHLVVAGHEFLHDLRREDRESYEALYQVVKDIIPEKTRLAKWKALNDKRAADGRQPISLSAVDEELVADFFGEQFTSREFWRRVQNRNPEGFAGLVQRLIDFLDNLAAKVTGVFRADIEAARDVAADVLANYVRKNPGEAPEAKFMTAWHGSPHEFDKFSTSAIGTGEGAQAYGWGLYFAGRKEVAEWYKKKLTRKLPNEIRIRSYELEGVRKWAVNIKSIDPRTASPDVVSYYATDEELGKYVQQDLVNDFLERSNSGETIDETIKIENKGRLYQVDLAPAEDEYLLWDKPLSEQSEKVREILADELKNYPEFEPGPAHRGSDFYQFMSRNVFPTDQLASEYLHFLGIRGVKYLEGASRAKGEGNYNYVIFDDQDVTIEAKFSEEPFRRQAQANLRGLGEALRSGSITTKALPAVLKFAPEQTVVDVFGDRIPRLAELADTRRRRDAVRTEIIDDFGIHGQRLTDAARRGPGVEAVENAAALGSFYQMFPDKPLLEQAWVPAAGTAESRLKAAQKAWESAGMDDATGLSFQAAHKKAAAAFDALKSEGLKEDYLVAVEMMGHTRDREFDALQHLIEEHTQDNPELRAEQLEKLAAAKNSIRGAYWPLYREGSYILEYLDQDGNRNVEFFESDFARRQNMAALQRLGVDPQSFRLDLKQEGRPYGGQIPVGYNEQLGKAVEANYLAQADQTDPDSVAQARARAQEVIRQMTEIWLRWQPETSALKNNIQRRNVLGFSMNMLRGFLRYGQSHAQRIANLEEGRKVEAILQDIDSTIKQRKAEGVDVTRERMVYADMLAREAMSKQTGSSKLAQILGKATTFHYMTSPSIALVQMSQLGVLTLPRLAVKTSLAQATKSLGKGIQWAFSPRYGRRAMLGDVAVSGAYDDLHAVVTQEYRDQVGDQNLKLGEAVFGRDELGRRIEQLSPYQQQLLALREAMAQNLLDISLSHEVGELVRGGDPESRQGRVFRGMMTFMRESEKASRKAAILAAFDAAQAGGKDFFAAMTDVKDLVDSTLYNYSKDAKGVALQGGVARVLTTFQHFRIMTAFKMALLFKQTFRGADPEVRRMAAKELVGIFGMSGLLAGTMGMPFAPVLMKVISEVVGDDDDPFDAEREFDQWLAENFGQTTADVVQQGPASLLGASLSRRIGLGDVFGSGQEAPPQLHGDGALAWWTTQLLGPSYGMVSGYARGYDEMFNKGEVLKGLISASPKPLKDALKAYSAATDGMRTGTGKRLLTADQVAANEVLLMGLGFAPLEIGRMKDKAFDTSRLGARISLRRGELIRDFIQAHQDGDDTTDARQAILTFNAKNPGFGIGSKDLRGGLRRALREDLGVSTRRERLLERRLG